ncbi:hypothetical protein [Candidatus Phaeomarinobacter ectocarpi]|uniref:hypothetical protein n=1 Tax=Candidatus Phaeomarinibacter ectocarpi TaxID=1458461 RepID=UPI0005C4E65E|nr:hypothetical protein [Candidatus Phaeomarinobacter ectocarpi]
METKQAALISNRKLFVFWLMAWMPTVVLRSLGISNEVSGFPVFSALITIFFCLFAWLSSESSKPLVRVLILVQIAVLAIQFALMSIFLSAAVLLVDPGTEQHSAVEGGWIATWGPWIFLLCATLEVTVFEKFRRSTKEPR